MERTIDKVRFGVIGMGGMGSFHANYIGKLEVDGAVLTAVSDSDAGRREKFARQTGLAVFPTHQEMLESGLVDAVLIATPHLAHPAITLDALSRGAHVLCEKPIAVGVKEARRLNAEYESKYAHLKFGIMLQLRTSPLYSKVRELIVDGELGEITRITWIATSWFRTWAYYASGGWRATWAGEGGGVLINQCPHNLDMLQWLTGLMPSRVTAVASIGKTHPIEVEDEVSAILEYPNGAVGHFVTTTGEAPGTDRLEIAGDRGRVVAENGTIRFFRTRQSVREITEKSPESFALPETWEIDVPYRKGAPEGHKVATQAFVRAILKGDKMVADGVEGVRGLEIGNAMLMAGLTRRPVDLPLDGDVYERFLQELAQKYGGRKNIPGRDVVTNFEASFVKQ